MYPPRPGVAVLSTGNVEDGEDLREALRRELAEERGLDIDQAEGGVNSCGSSTATSPRDAE
ncbi:NUDIX domain-containing protein [Streptomyces sp. ISL-66]|uniref:NUDIX domain-containing protein n=1 Tax=Streptomyces sp. ISL-66 TaxID=2819186 RepID=UPI001BE6C921|nr:NUDIX domain-containing protein [Streptomyces sp. ISL-66]MBT2466677.1 NUDIX domain-containing protein [Streptomyces sp. ISL-66]